MSIKNILYDLDGTLLPMDQNEFTKKYFSLIAAQAAGRGYDAEAVAGHIWAGVKAMVLNNGKRFNVDAFWDVFMKFYPDRVFAEEKAFFDDFYANEFEGTKEVCGYDPMAAKTIKAAREMGFDQYLATNPIFPRTATLRRISWAGLSAEDFKYISVYENSTFCKPNPMYFSEFLEKNGLCAQECLMVGNDMDEDTPAADLGMKVFILTDCLINKSGRDISAFPNGSFDALMEYIGKL
mgnify:FL=1